MCVVCVYRVCICGGVCVVVWVCMWCMYAACGVVYVVNVDMTCDVMCIVCVHVCVCVCV